MSSTDTVQNFEEFALFIEQQIPFNRHLGLQVVRLAVGECIMKIPWQSHLIGDPFRPAVHGGVTSMLADATGGAACFTQLGSPQVRVSTVDLRIDYLRPGPQADLVCHARVVRMGNRVAVVRMRVFSGDLPERGSDAWDKPIATGQGVYNVHRKADPSV